MMPEYRSPWTLQQVCLEAVGSNMDFWCKDFADNFQVMKAFKYFIGPFDNISSVVCEVLLEHLIGQRNLKRPYLYLLINPSLVNLNLSGCPHLVKDDIINAVLTRCKNLKSINLSGCTQVKKEIIVTLAEAYPNLVSLDLSGTKCVKMAARAVFKNCTNLKELFLSHCRIYDDDLSILIDSVNNKGTHKNLRRFDLYYTGVSCNGLALVVRSLPWVTILKHQDLVKCLSAVYDELIQAGQGGCKPEKDVYEAEQSSCNTGHKTFNFRSLTIHEHTHTSSRVLSNCFMLCPHLVKVEVLEVYGYDNKCFYEMGSLSMLQDLKIICNRNCNVDFVGLLQALKKIGSNLKHLALADIEGLNPLKIAQLCPNLIELYLTCYDSKISFHGELDEDCPSQKICLPKLKMLTVGGNGLAPRNITQPVLTRFLCACCVVEKLKLVQLSELTDTVLNDMFKVNEMPCLTSLDVSCCQNITSNSLDKLILSQTNKLSSVKIIDCWNITQRDYSNWLATSKENNSSLKIDWS
ncbi:uncharacterized protein LOC117115685 [Anneissia japonica]|uniref:uncharacterized protein LOC117115685 n=1 Tax=Anneissia japonica TaxID=1529436 RepID=UPI0014254D0B|nr:uncharacterized protein LOC117115685 [Anneissia japonica]